MEYITQSACQFLLGFGVGLFAFAFGLLAATLAFVVVVPSVRWIRNLIRPKPPILTNYVPPFQDLNPISRHRMGQ
jgi:hypothetical protein